MNFPWKTIVNAVAGIAAIFVPGLGAAISAVEAAMPSASGADKKTAALTIAGILATEANTLYGRDVLSVPTVVAAISTANDAFVAAKNAEAALIAAIQSAEAAVKAGHVVLPAVTGDGTGVR